MEAVRVQCEVETEF